MRSPFLYTLCLLAWGASALAAPPDALVRETPDQQRALAHSARKYEDLKAIWQGRRDVSPKQADAVVAQVEATRLDNGIGRLDPFAIALLREAHTAAEQGDQGRARGLVEQARRLAPGLPAVEEGAAAVALAGGLGGLGEAAQASIRARVLALDDFSERMVWLADLAALALLVLMLTAGVFFLSQLLRYGFALYHDLGHVFPRAFKALLVALAALVVVLPLVMGYGPYLLFFPLVVVLWPYQRRGERLVAAVFTLALAALPWGIRAAEGLSRAGTGVWDAVAAVQRNPADRRALRALTAEATPEADWAVHATVGLALKRLGRLDDAFEALAHAEQRAKGDQAAVGLIKNNLGNALFASGRVATAEQHYLDAKRLLPGAPEPIFNLYRLYQRTGQMDAAATQMSQASAIAPARVAAWNEDTDLNLNRYVVDLELSSARIAHRARVDLFAPTAFSSRVWLLLAGPLPEAAAPLGGVMALVLCVLVIVRQRRLHLTRPCPRCNNAVRQPLPAVSKRRDQLCPECVDMFVRNLPMDRRIRFRKEEQITRARSLMTWSTRVAGLALPGLAALVRGRPGRGVFTAAITLTLLTMLIWPQGLLFTSAPPGLAATGALVPMILLGLLWLWSLVSAFQLSASREGQT